MGCRGGYADRCRLSTLITVSSLDSVQWLEPLGALPIVVVPHANNYSEEN